MGLAEKMAAYRWVYDSRHLQPLTAKMLRTGISISSGTLRSVIEYGLPLTLRRKMDGIWEGNFRRFQGAKFKDIKKF